MTKHTLKSEEKNKKSQTSLKSLELIIISFWWRRRSSRWLMRTNTRSFRSVLSSSRTSLILLFINTTDAEFYKHWSNMDRKLIRFSLLTILKSILFSLWVRSTLIIWLRKHTFLHHCLNRSSILERRLISRLASSFYISLLLMLLSIFILTVQKTSNSEEKWSKPFMDSTFYSWKQSKTTKKTSQRSIKALWNNSVTRSHSWPNRFSKRVKLLCKSWWKRECLGTLLCRQLLWIMLCKYLILKFYHWI